MNEPQGSKAEQAMNAAISLIDQEAMLEIADGIYASRLSGASTKLDALSERTQDALRRASETIASDPELWAAVIEREQNVRSEDALTQLSASIPQDALQEMDAFVRGNPEQGHDLAFLLENVSQEARAAFLSAAIASGTMLSGRGETS